MFNDAVNAPEDAIRRQVVQATNQIDEAEQNQAKRHYQRS